MSRTAWFHCFAGVAGDMVLGSLLDAGADVNDVRAAVARLGVEGWSLGFEHTMRQGLHAGRALVDAPTTHEHRPYREIRALLDAADLPQRVRERSHAVFAALAAAEAELHGTTPDDVEFHEVGALDAIVDVVGSCAALESLDIETIVCSPIAVGMGTIRAAHGTLPNPAPAVAALAAAHHAPLVGTEEPMELATPTGVALMAALADRFGALPSGAVMAAGLGAGGRDLAGRPNVVQVLVIETAAEASGEPHQQTLTLLQTNVDDVTGEVLAFTVARAMATGALDAWITPIVMKKGRPAHTVQVLCEPAQLPTMRDLLMAELGTLGVRASAVDRWATARTIDSVQVQGHTVRIKRSAMRFKVEHDDAAAAATALGIPLREVVSAAEQQAQQQQ